MPKDVKTGAPDTWRLKKEDRQVTGIALTLLGKALDAAVGALKGVGCASYNVTVRVQDLESLTGLLYDPDGANGDLVIPLELCPTFRVGLSLHYDAVQTVKKAKAKLQIEAEEEAVRERQLERIFSDLDVALMQLAPRNFDLAEEVAKIEALKRSKKKPVDGDGVNIPGAIAAELTRDGGARLAKGMKLKKGESAEVSVGGKSILKLEGK